MFGNQNMQNDSNKTVKLILAIGLVVAALIASAGVFYYYAVFIPQLEQEKFELEKQKLKDKQEAEANAAKQKELESEQRSQAYQTCINEAEITYLNNWGSACKKQSERNKASLENCLNDPRIMNNQFMGESYCYKLYGNTKYDPDCILPKGIADGIEKYRSDRKDACLTEAQQSLY